MLFISLAFSAALLGVVNSVAFWCGKTGVGRASLCGVAAAVFFFMTTVEVLALNALLVAVVGAVCWAVRARRRWFLASSLGATVAAYAVVSLPDLWAWERLKKDYPMESLAPRLAYEDRSRQAPSPEVITLNPTTQAGLAHLAARIEYEESGFYAPWIRTQALERLHAGVVQQFIESPGFGVGRMRYIASPYRLEHDQDQVPPIPQPSPDYPRPDLAPAPVLPAPEPEQLAAHENNIIDFLNVVGFGYTRGRDHVAGFRPHCFHEAPRAAGAWRVGRLDLVSLLKYDEPVVYLSADFPRMDELRQAPARPLDAFEQEALAELRRGEDLMVQESPRQMRMLGSIRAVPQCLGCHSVRGGELLGAFSYQLSPEQLPSP